MYHLKNIFKKRKYLIYIFFLSLVIRLSFVFISNNYYPIKWDSSDSKVYMSFALAFTDQGITVPDVNKTYMYDSKPLISVWDFVPPLYPLIISIFLSMTDNPIFYLYIFQALLSSFIPLIFYLLVSKIFSEKLSILFSIWAIVYYPYITYTNVLMKEIFIFFLFLSVIYLVVYKLKSASVYKVFYLIVMILLLHLDERFIIYLFIIPLIQISILKQNFRLVLALSAIIIIGLIPWNLRNYYVYNEFKYMANRVELLEKTNDPTLTVNSESRDFVDIERIIVKSFENFKKYFIFYRTEWGFAKNLIIFIQFGLFIPFFIPGIYYLFKFKEKILLIFLIIFLSHMSLHIILWGQFRYKYPADPFFIIIAFYGIYKLYVSYYRSKICN